MKQKKVYYPAIEGLRVFALVGVLLYHLIPEWVPGGYYGVLLFLVLSGFLSSKKLLDDWDTNKKIKLTQFYKSRLKRLFPSVIWLLMVCSCLFIYLGNRFLIDFRGVFFSSVLQVNNWWQIAAGKSYFEQLGAPSPFNHLWYMSIIGQLYILFPLFFGVAIHYLKTSKKMIQLLLGIIFGSALLMGVLFYLDDNLNRVYYGTDTRLFSFFVGVLLAVVHFNLEKNKKVLSRKSQYVLLLISFSAMTYFMIAVYDYQAFNYIGGMLLFSFFSAGAVWAVLDQNNQINRLCSNKAVAYLSKRSFQIYLWQYPVIIAYNEMIPVQTVNWIHLFIKLSIIAFFSEISFQLIEKKRYQVFNIERSDSFSLTKWFSIRAAAVAVVSLTLFALTVAPETSGFEEDIQEEFAENQEALEDFHMEEEEAHPFENELLEKGLSQEEIREAQQIKLIAVGDSILLNVAPELKKVFPNAVIDADVGRQLYNSQEIFASLHTQYPNTREVIIFLGSNGNFKKNDLENIVSLFPLETTIYVVNTTVPKSWQTSVNNTLVNTSRENANVHLIDWRNESLQHRADWFYEDGTHMNQEGREALIQLIAEMILKE